jgi:chromosome segregation ATPase
MKRADILKKIFSGLALFSLSIAFSCQTPRQAERTEPRTQDEPRAQREAEDPIMGEAPVREEAPREYALSEEAVLELDRKIRDLNQDLTEVERQVRTASEPIPQNVLDTWNRIEKRRGEVNEHIESYNEALETDQGREAASIRDDINRILGELEAEINNLRDVFARENQRGEPTPN